MFPSNVTNPISGPTRTAGNRPQPDNDGSNASSKQEEAPKVERKEAPKVSFSVQIDYLLAAHRDDIQDGWAYQQSPPPFVYPTARVAETGVDAFARSYIEHLIREADLAYHGGKDDAATQLRAGHRDVTHDSRAWAWRVEVGTAIFGTKPIPPPPEWLRDSISEHNRWLGVRITSPAMWSAHESREGPVSFRYVQHILHALTRALDFQTPEGCTMAVSVGAGKRAFSLNELQRLAAGLFITGHLLSALPYHRKPQASSPNGQRSGGGGGGGRANNAIDSKLASDLRRLGVGKGKADSKALADAAFLHPDKLFLNRTIPRGTLPLPQPQPLNYLAAASKQLFNTATPEEIGTLMHPIQADRLPAVDFSHYREGRYRDGLELAQRKTTIACRQLGATTDAESVAVWCNLVTRMAVTFLNENSEVGWDQFLYCCEKAEVSPDIFDIFDMLSTFAGTDIAESVQRRIIEKSDQIPWADPFAEE
ncbi:hypothetical protein PG993_007378 [Apiospora rasikravindrae]|uniref:Uncharacterized protein n=1 Tax=Apiospora rasikravindrae TaxID=990691 RepID=A0ABR1SXC2_9PEZI